MSFILRMVYNKNQKVQGNTMKYTVEINEVYISTHTVEASSAEEATELTYKTPNKYRTGEPEFSHLGSIDECTATDENGYSQCYGNIIFCNTLKRIFGTKDKCQKEILIN